MPFFVVLGDKIIKFDYQIGSKSLATLGTKYVQVKKGLHKIGFGAGTRSKFCWVWFPLALFWSMEDH